MSDTEKSYELLKPGLSYVTERTSAFGYSDVNGKMQYIQPVSRYKAFNEIKRGEVVSVVTKQELEDRAISVNKWQDTDKSFEWNEQPADPDTNNVQLDIVGGKPVVVHDWKIYEITDVLGSEEITFVKRIDNYYDNYLKDGEIDKILTKSEVTYYSDLTLSKRITFPFKIEKIGTDYNTFQKIAETTVEGWNDNESINIYVSYETEDTSGTVIRSAYAYSQTKVNEIMADPDPYVVQTNTKVHERTIGIAMEYAEGYGSVIHVQPYGKFIYDPKYENKFDEYYAGTEHEEFNHTGKEYNPGFTYEDVGKKVFVCFPKDGDNGGHLTVNEEETSKHYHNIICLGYLTDAPQEAGKGKTEIEINISGDQRGLLESTQFEATLGENVIITRKDPLRVFAIGKESDTKFKARLCFTPQNTTNNIFSNVDFIAFQKMDGNTAIIYFTEGDFNLQGVVNDEDVAFLHMAKCYASIKTNGEIKTINITGLNDLQTTAGVGANINKFFAQDQHNKLSDAFKVVSGNDLYVKNTFASQTDPYGYIDLESSEFGGYYAMYISSGIRSKFDGSITTCHGSYENHGKAVLADIRVPERRDILGIYYGALWDQELKKDYTTIFMRLGEFDVPEYSLQADGNFVAGQEYYLGTNGRVVKYPYNQYDFVSKVGSIKYGVDGDLRFIVDVGESTRHYNGDLPVGYMKPAVHFGTEYTAEYGFLLMDGVTAYPKEHPYDALYERLLGWFDPTDVNIEGSNKFKVPSVSRMIPDEVTVNGETVQTQVQVPMQIKFLPSGIYEEMPRIPFKRFFGRFKEDSAIKVEDDWTPVKCIIDDCDITDIVDYGISEDGYTKPGLDNLDIHLFIDPNENYVSGAHDWHEVHEGFINWNNSTTFGYTWEILEEEASLEHPYGSYKLRMVIGNSQGVAYVTSDNQAPKKLNGCYYKLYVARREVFARQFDIEKIYKDYLTNSVFTDDTKTSTVVDRAVTGKAVLDAIENRYSVKKLIGAEDSTIELGKLGAPTGTLTLNTKGSLPIIGKNGVIIQNEEDNTDLDEIQRASKLIFKDGIFKKGGAYGLDRNIFDITDGEYDVDENEIPVVGQVRKHAEATIDNKPYSINYADKDNKTGKIHGMHFGKGGNVDASTLWGFIPKVTSKDSIVSTDSNTVYVPVVHKSGDKWTRTVEGYTSYRDNNDSQISRDVLTESVIYGITQNVKFNDTDTVSSQESAIKNTDTIYGRVANMFYKNGERKVQALLDMENGVLSLQKTNGANILGGLDLYVGAIVNTSRSEYKRVHGEIIRDTNLVEDADLVYNSKQYSDEPVETTVKVDEAFSGIVEDYRFAESTNKLKNMLGSALQAAYEMPLAYWQYNTEKEWYKDRLGVIVQRVESVAKNITGKKYATATIGSLIVTSNTYGDNDIKIILTRQGKTKEVKIETVKGSEIHECFASKVGDVENNKLVTFSGVADAELLIADQDFLANQPYEVQLEGGSETGTERKLFDYLYDTNGDDAVVTTPEAQATATIGNLVVTAKEAGTAGNKIAVSSEYSNENSHYIVKVYKNGKVKSTYLGTNIDELHTEDYEPVDDPYVTFAKVGDDNELSEFDKTYLTGGTSGTSVSKNLVNTDYKENTYQYTEDEAKSIKEYLTTIIDNSSNGQDVLSTIGLLLSAAKETQERLLRVEASTFGRDYETIPGNHEPYKLTDMPGVVPDPTNYGLNRLIRAICQELYYDSNPFDEALNNGGEVNTSSFSRIDRIDREIHGELNTEDGVKTAPNTLNEIDSSTYPYEDMIRAKDDTEIREAEFTMETYDETATERGTNVKTRVDMSLYNKNSDGDYKAELDTNIAEKSGQFNGIVDAIYRITTKLNALTESINNSDNIADSPKRLNTIRQNIEHIIREAYFDDAYVIDVAGEEEKATPGEDTNVKVFKTHEKINAEPYHDVNGPENAPYMKNVSRFDKLTNDLYNYTISVSGEGYASFQNFYELGDEKVVGKPHRDPVTGEITIQDSDTQVYYTGRKFNGKHLLVDNIPTSDGTEINYTTETHVPQNLNDYNYATLLDIVVDAIGSEFFRKNVSKKENKDDSWNNREELRHNKTISERLDEIEDCLDKVVGKLSRKHSFEEETDVFYVQDGSTSSESRTDGNKGANAHDTVFSIDRYLQFMNDYLGYRQETKNDINYGKDNYTDNPTEKYTETYTEHWKNGYDYKIDGAETSNAVNSGIDGIPPSGELEYSAEWALANKRNIHAGLVNILSRIQNEETRSSRYDAILGDDFKSTAEGLKTVYQDFGVDGKTGESDFQTRESSVEYNLTDDIMDILKTIYGKDNHDTLQSHDGGSFTDFKHRTIIKGEGEDATPNVRFTKDYANGNNIIDVMIHDMYFLPQPLRPFDSSLGDTDSKISNNPYFTDKNATNSDKSVLFVPTDNSKEMDETNHHTLDSRLAKYYDFDCDINTYDIPDNENALSWNNREEFFNETGRFTDSEIKKIPHNVGEPHARLSRFEVIENEIRKLRKLIGLDFPKWNGESDLVDLKFNGILKFYGDRLNNGFSGNPFGEDVGSTSTKSYTDQFNQGGGNDGKEGATTNILKFILNADKSERLLRTELGFSNGAWGKEKFGTTSEQDTGYWFWYDNTYGTRPTSNEHLVSSNLTETGTNDLANYGLYTQHQDETYEYRRTVYDRLLALEKNAVQVDAWLDSVKNTYHNGVGKDSGTGNIYDIVTYLGNYTWDDVSKHYYGQFGQLNLKDLRLSEKDNVSNRYDNVTNELTGHHDALKEIFDIIGIDDNDGTLYVTGTDNKDKERSVEKYKTLWARLNAVENLNRYDLDITNVVTTNFNDGDEKAPNGMVALTDGKGDFITTVQGNIKTLSEAGEALTKNVKDWKVGAKELIASKGYVDNAIVAAINEYAETVDEGDENYATVRINDVDINLDGTQKSNTKNEDGSETIENWSCDISNETEARANEITLTDIKDHFGNDRGTLDEEDYFNAKTINSIVNAVNKLNKKNQENVNRVYNNVNNLMNTLHYQYNDELTQTTTGSLLNF